MPSSFTRATLVIGTSPSARSEIRVVNALLPLATRSGAATRGDVIVLSGQSPSLPVDAAPSKDPSRARVVFVVSAWLLSNGPTSHPKRSEPKTKLANSCRMPRRPETDVGTPPAATAGWCLPTPNTKSPPGPKTTKPAADAGACGRPRSVDTYSGWVWYAIMPGSSVGLGRLFDIFLALCSAYCSKPFP